MKAHKLIEDIKNYDQQVYRVNELKSSIKFDLGDMGTLIDISKLYKGGEINLPFPVCLFEMRDIDKGVGANVCVLVEDEGDHFVFSVYMAGSSTSSGWDMFKKRISVRKVIDQSPDGFQMCAVDPITGKSEPLGDGVTGSDSMFPFFCMIILTCCYVMSCSNVELKDNHPPEKLNKKRLKRGKQPLFSYKTLHIKCNDKTIKGNNQGGTHASPRVHLRRGHIRSLANGLRIWVQSCVVGSKENGMIHKDYAVEL